jgi:serine/threonine protein kinase
MKVVSAQPKFRVFHSSNNSMARPSILSRFIQSILSFIRWIHQFMQSLIERYTSATITLDSGRTVRIGPKLAEGGFSIVFQARDTQTNSLYALKRIQCPDKERLRDCLREAGVHRSLDHPNLMPLLGFGESSGGGGSNQHQLQHDHCCYMLFPYCTHSLREEVNRRTMLLEQPSSSPASSSAPWKEVKALQTFLSICRSVQAMHMANLTHRDIKLENILFQDFTNKQPLLMDFGSCGSLTQSIADRRQVMVRIL